MQVMQRKEVLEGAKWRLRSGVYSSIHCVKITSPTPSLPPSCRLFPHPRGSLLFFYYTPPSRWQNSTHVNTGSWLSLLAQSSFPEEVLHLSKLLSEKDIFCEEVVLGHGKGAELEVLPRILVPFLALALA